MSVSNAAVAALLERFGGLLRLSGANPFRVKAFLHAAAAIRGLDEPVTELVAQERLREVDGIGSGIAAAIAEIVDSGTFGALNALAEDYPPSLLRLLNLPGVGPKTVLRLHREFGVSSLGEVKAAAASGVFGAVQGLGPRFETDLACEIAAVETRGDPIPIGRALPAARSFQAARQRALPGRVEIAGGVRRFAESVDRLTMVVEAVDPSSASAAIAAIPIVSEVLARHDRQLRVRLQSGEEADVHLAQPADFGADLIRATGPDSHLESLVALPRSGRFEADVYAALGLA